MYKRYAALPMPEISAATLQVDIFPQSRDLRIRGTYRLVNRTGQPLQQIHVDLLDTLRIRRLELGVPAPKTIADGEKGYHTFRPGPPPGAGGQHGAAL